MCFTKLLCGMMILSCIYNYTGVKEFLIESRPKLQAVFGNCSFDNVDACVANLNEETVKRIARLEEIGRKLLGRDYPRRDSTSDSEGMQFYN